ncbi:hypothetical protein [Streptomyces sp. NPDC050600]|uniref:hypothetical protein n=1 Tax=unclassified Streptomyces TaxID=2593676 RepID=UPI0034188D4F
MASCMLAVTVILGAGTAASASDIDNLYSPEACKSPDYSSFKFTIHYNSGQAGAYRNLGYSIWDFADAPDGVNGTAVPLDFCTSSVSSGVPGAGQHIKNNAASAENFHYKYWARVYYNSGYKGPQDVMAPYQHIDRFVNVYNENASFQWTSS